ncbi:MAG: 1-deoxy-D-xylulose-5-phosphate reductoisomerase [Clostridia bacterium]
MVKKDIIILGSTGSIGTQTLQIVQKYSQLFNVVGMSCNNNIGLFVSQVNAFKPKYIAVPNPVLAQKVMAQLSYKPILFDGENCLQLIVSVPEGELVVTAIVGICGLIPTITAIKHKKNIALANKETLVAGGSVVTKLAKSYGVQILPVDSEHSAIWQCLDFNFDKDIKKILLTASGGPFFNFSAEQLKNVTLEQALKHPTWNMGAKVTIDSSTLMNKGLELIEAIHLFNVGEEKIKIVVQRESYIHSMVQFCDGSIIAQMSKPTMLLPIQLALTYPQRLPCEVEDIDWTKLTINCDEPDYNKFECLKIARACAKELGLKPAIMNSANEFVVKKFLNKQINYNQIPYYINKALDKIESKAIFDEQDILETDFKTKKYLEDIMES